MQLHLTFSGQDIRLPMAYGYEIQSMLYHALAQDPEYQSFLHSTGYGDTRSFKLFTFGRLEGSYRPEGRTLLFPRTMQLEVRSQDPRFLQLLSYRFRPGTQASLLGNQLTVCGCRLEDLVIYRDCLHIRTRSPVTVYRTGPEGRRYPAPAEPEFSRLIGENAARKWQALYHRSIPGPVSLEPLPETCRKVVTLYKGTHVTAWLGDFRLRAPLEVMNLLYNVGLGSKNAQGFGMFSPAPDVSGLPEG